MIVNLNKIYFMSAPPETVGMTPGPEDFIETTSQDGAYVRLKRIHYTKDKDETLKSISKVFEHLNRPMQAVIWYTDIGDADAKKRVNTGIDNLKKNQKEAAKPKNNVQEA